MKKKLAFRKETVVLLDGASMRVLGGNVNKTDGCGLSYDCGTTTFCPSKTVNCESMAADYCNTLAGKSCDSKCVSM